MRSRRKPDPPAPLSRETLEEALARVAEDYARFVRLGAAALDDPKAFGAHHAAAKTALAHLEALREMAGLGPAECDPAAEALALARQEMGEGEA